MVPNRKISQCSRPWLAASLLLISASGQLQAEPGSRILATSGAMQFEGSAGGGIVPWAVIAGYGSDTEIGGAAYYTALGVNDFSLWSAGAAVGFYNRVEVSLARQHLDVLPLGLDIEQDVVGLKARLFGDLIYGAAPQVSAGLQYKRNRDALVPTLLGATDDSGIDYYVSASKLWLGGAFGYNLLTNLTLRHSEANETGFLGFGSSNGDSGEWLVEGSAAMFLNRHWAVGVEYREKPDQLGLGEEHWADAFVAWFPSKRVALVGAYTDLGKVAGLPDQSGWYLSLQLTQ